VNTRSRIHGRPARVATALALGIVVSVGATYYLTYEPAPSVRVRWRSDVTPSTRTELERTFLLVDPAAHEGSTRIFQYDLLDTSQSNIEALVMHPAVEDTDEIDRHHYVVPADAPYGSRWMWVAHRIPLVRHIAPAFRRERHS
jgi:hypothetical protein